MTRAEARLIAEEIVRLQAYNEPYIGRKEAAEYLSISVTKLDHEPTIPRYRIGGSVRYRKSALDRWVMAQN